MDFNDTERKQDNNSLRIWLVTQTPTPTQTQTQTQTLSHTHSLSLTHTDRETHSFALLGVSRQKKTPLQIFKEDQISVDSTVQ